MQPCLRLTFFCGNENVKYCHSSKSRLQRFSFAEQEMQFIQHGAFLEFLANSDSANSFIYIISFIQGDFGFENQVFENLGDLVDSQLRYSKVKCFGVLQPKESTKSVFCIYGKKLLLENKILRKTRQCKKKSVFHAGNFSCNEWGYIMSLQMIMNGEWVQCLAACHCAVAQLVI